MQHLFYKCSQALTELTMSSYLTETLYYYSQYVLETDDLLFL